MVKRRLLLLFIAVIIGVLCWFNSSNYIRSHQWKHSRKSSWGDWMEFDNALYKLNWRTVYKSNQPVGKVLFCFEKYLIVYVYADKSVGYYYRKS